jgi:hypothetical protein
MESKIRYVLKHKETGLYYGYNAQPAKHLFSAWRFESEEYLKLWLEHANYRPKHPEEYELIAVKQTIEEVEIHGTDGA